MEIVARFAMGASLEEVLLGFTPPISRRSLQRWLSVLLKEKRLMAIGKARARRYVIPTGVIVSSPIPLSQESELIQLEVSQPIQARRSVEYRRGFLDEYQPNRTFYLDERIRIKLFQIGDADGNYPAGTYARQIFQRLLIDLSWNSSRLEGNTYSLLETERLLEFGKAAEGKNLKDTQMILNHKAAIEFLIGSAEEIGINRYTILNLHTLLSDNLMPDPEASGRLRSIPVGIAKSVYRPIAIPQLISECFDLLLAKANEIEDPFEQAFFLMVHVPYLQAFDDVNKRTSRLAANIPLIKKNLCPLSFIDVPEKTYINGLLAIYELNRVDLLRDVFVWAYERSCALYSTARKVIGEPDEFRMKYRNQIQHVVREIVLNIMDKVGAILFIQKFSLESVPELDQAKFIEVVERELRSLHEGNIARFKLKPKEFDNWKGSWK